MKNLYFDVQNCNFEINIKCPKTFSQLDQTDTPRVRNCETCMRNVYLCETEDELIEHVSEGHCVALLSEGFTKIEEPFVGELLYENDYEDGSDDS